MNRKFIVMIISAFALALVSACASSKKVTAGPKIEVAKTETKAEPAQRDATIDTGEPTPEGAAGYFNRGNKRFMAGNFPGAIADYSEVVKLNPAQANAWHNRCVSKINTKDFPGSIEDCNQAITLNPAYAIAYNSRCWARTQAKQDLPLALADCNKAIQMDPTYANSYDSRGHLYIELNDKQAAIKDLEKALQLDPSLKETADALEKAKQMPEQAADTKK